MQEIESIINQLCEKTKKDRYEIKKMIEDKQVKFKHQISEIAAAKIIAKELNIELSQKTKKTTNIDEILHFPPGTPDVSIIGIVSRMYSPLTFNKTQGTGKVQHFLLADNSGDVRIILWDGMVDLVNKLNLEIGTIVQIYKGIVRMGKSGEREIHLNELSSIQSSLKENHEENLPKVLERIETPDKIKIENKNKEIDIKGLISSKGEIRTFQKDNREGKLLPFTLSGEKKHVKLIAWGEKADEFTNYNIGDELLIQGSVLKINREDQPEIHVNRRSLVKVISKNNKIPEGAITTNLKMNIQSSDRTISNNRAGEKETVNLIELEQKPYSKIIVRICFVDQARSFTRKDGNIGHLIRIGVYDSSGSNVLVLWDEKAQEAETWTINSIIEVSDVYLRDNPRGGKEIYITRSASMKIIDENGNQIPNNIPIIPINQLNRNWKIASISGKILDISETREFTGQKDGVVGQVRWLRIVDKTGTIRVVAWNDQVLEYDSLQLDELIQIHIASIQIQEGGLELHLTINSKIESNNNFSQPLPEWAELSNIIVPEFPSQGFHIKEFSRTTTLNLDLEDPYVELRARIKQLGDREPYYFACPKCSQKISDDFSDSAQCSSHGEQKPIPKLRIPIVLDDGYGTLYTTLFSPTAEILTGIIERNLMKIDNFDELTDKIKDSILGRDYIFQGILKERVVGEPPRKTWNFNVRNVYNPNTVYEINMLYDKLEEEES
ncbi:MAG: Replication factor A [Candidatus Heimdallarchaeota archaeon LC_3]|nr:MAG: Replication factor A [Candidatus Heimdallarchaeota archaeon LC_3]